MRILNILSGVAVLIITLGFGAHLLHHIFVQASHQVIQSPAVWAGIAAVVVVGIFSSIGGCSLLRR